MLNRFDKFCEIMAKEDIIRSLSKCRDGFCILDELDRLGSEVLEYFNDIRFFIERAFSEFSCLSVAEVKRRYKNIASLWRDTYKELFWNSCKPPTENLMLIEGLDIPKRIETLFNMHLSNIPNITEPEILHLIQRFLDTISSRYRGELFSGLRDAAIYGFLKRISSTLSSMGLSLNDVIEEFLEKGSIESLIDTLSEKYVREHKLDKFIDMIVEDLGRCKTSEGYDSVCVVKILDRVVERIYFDWGNEFLARYVLLHRDLRNMLSSISCVEITRGIRASARLRNARLDSVVLDICRSPNIETYLGLDLGEKESIAMYIAYKWANHALREIENLTTDDAIVAVIEEYYTKGIRQIPREFVTDKAISTYRNQFIQTIKTGLPQPLRHRLDIEGILSYSTRARRSEFEQRIESSIFRGEEIDIDNLINLVTYDPATLDFNKLYERLESIVETLRKFYIVKGLQGNVLAESANVITRILRDERVVKAIARSMLCREYSKPIEPFADLHPNIYEIKDQVLETLSNVMSSLRCGPKARTRYTKIVIGLTIAIAIMVIIFVLFLLLR